MPEQSNLSNEENLSSNEIDQTGSDDQQPTQNGFNLFSLEENNTEKCVNNSTSKQNTDKQEESFQAGIYLIERLENYAIEVVCLKAENQTKSARIAELEKENKEKSNEITFLEIEMNNLKAIKQTPLSQLFRQSNIQTKRVSYLINLT